MEVNQIYDIVNEIGKQALGDKAVSVVDTTSLVNLGGVVLSTSENIDLFFKSLADRIGRTMVGIRKYNADKHPLRRNDLEFGMAIQKLNYSMPDATDNPHYIADKQKNPYDIESTISVTQDIFSKTAAYSFETKVPTDQLKFNFVNEQAMAAFINGIYICFNNRYESALKSMDSLAICTDIVETLEEGSSKQKRNLLAEYNALTTSSLTAEECMRDSGFLRYAAYEINLVTTKLNELTRLYNVNRREKFTGKGDLVVDFSSYLDASLKTYLRADTYHEELIKIPNYHVVNSWQAGGTADDFDSCTTVAIKNGEIEKTQKGIIAHLYDVEHVFTLHGKDKMISMLNEFSGVNVMAHQALTGYAIDKNENSVVFYVE